MTKFLKKFACYTLILFLLVWGISILKCEILTYYYGNQFSNIYKENTMIGDIDYLKVLDYSGSNAIVYYVSKNGMGGNIIRYFKTDNSWVIDGWVKTIWSKTGSADGFIWPYIR